MTRFIERFYVHSLNSKSGCDYSIPAGPSRLYQNERLFLALAVGARARSRPI
jgi:hypothetical protein